MARETLNNLESRSEPRIVRDILIFRRSWQDFEDRQPPKQRAEVIDLNVSPFDFWPRRFIDRRDIRNAAEDLLDRIKRDRILPQFEREYQAAHTNASLAYLTELNGHRYDFNTYVHETLLVWPMKYSEGEIAFLKNEISLLLAELRFDGDFNTALMAFREANKFPNEAVIEAMREYTEEFIPRLRNYVGVDADIDYEIVPVEHNVPWKAWLKGEGDQIKLEINIHPERAQWFRGEEERVAKHERTHVYQMACLKKSIEEGKVSPASGITTMHTPETVSAEGVATVLPLLNSDFFPLSPEGEIAVRKFLLEKMVLHNAHIDINTASQYNRHLRQESMYRNIKYVASHIPYLKPTEIKDILNRRLYSALDRGYELSYTAGAQLHFELFEHLGRNQELFRLLVREQFVRPMTALQIREFADDLREGMVSPNGPLFPSASFAPEV